MAWHLNSSLIYVTLTTCVMKAVINKVLDLNMDRAYRLEIRREQHAQCNTETFKPKAKGFWNTGEPSKKLAVCAVSVLFGRIPFLRPRQPPSSIKDTQLTDGEGNMINSKVFYHW